MVRAIFLGALCALPALPWATFRSEAHSRSYGPRATVHVARPTLRWEVWPGQGSRVTDSVMTINGRTVRAKYDLDQRVLLYTPSTPLTPGSYKVSAKVVVDDLLPVKREWEFRVVSNALRELPQPNAQQHEGLAAVNEYRRTLGLPDFNLDDRLCAAALRHSEYLARNNRTGHYQKPGDALFFGASPGDRLDAFGFTDDSWEGVDYGSNTPAESVRRLFDAPYHRLPFLQPGQAAIGTGYFSQRMTLEFEMSHDPGTVVSPADGERNVPIDWDGRERPDPLRLHAMHGRVGYPIVFAHFTPTGERIRVKKATLRTALGQSVPFVLNTPENDDHLEFAAIVIPRQPLKPGTGYEVKVEATTASGRNVSRSWRFVTAK